MVAAVHGRSHVVDTKCWRCGVVSCVILNKQDFLDWLSGSGSIEDILDYLSADERELLLSNTCGRCFDSLFEDLDTDD
jgi:hypothetical protein